MELNGEEKIIRALFREMKLEDERATPFSLVNGNEGLLVLASRLPSVELYLQSLWCASF